MSEATFIVIHKEGKDQLNVSSYHPISLLCSDVNILDKMLATHLNGCIQKCMQPDQSGFIPNRSTSINIRRILLNMQIPTEKAGSRAILALDATKVFDSLEWNYLWRVLERFEFGPSFMRWVKILYSEPRAKIKINSEHSELFQLERGTRQSCPISPLLFALEMESIAIMTRSMPGRYTGVLEADRRGHDSIVCGRCPVLPSRCCNITDHSDTYVWGVWTILWSGCQLEKPALLTIDPLGNQIPSGTPHLKVVAMLKYLGIWITSEGDGG